MSACFWFLIGAAAALIAWNFGCVVRGLWRLWRAKPEDFTEDNDLAGQVRQLSGRVEALEEALAPAPGFEIEEVKKEHDRKYTEMVNA